MKWLGNPLIKAKRCISWLSKKSQENVLVLGFIHISKIGHLQQFLKLMQSSKAGMWKENYLLIGGIRNGYLFGQNVDLRTGPTRIKRSWVASRPRGTLPWFRRWRDGQKKGKDLLYFPFPLPYLMCLSVNASIPNVEVHSTRKWNRLVLSCRISNVEMLMPDVTWTGNLNKTEFKAGNTEKDWFISNDVFLQATVFRWTLTALVWKAGWRVGEETMYTLPSPDHRRRLYFHDNSHPG